MTDFIANYFHYLIVRASGNPVLERLLCEELYHVLRLYRHKFSGYPGRPRQALDEHRAIVGALQDGDGEFAELLMRRHIARARQNIEAAAAASTNEET